MDILKQLSINEMKQARESLLSLPKDCNLLLNLNGWFNAWENALNRFDSVRGGIGTFKTLWSMYSNFSTVNDIEILSALRSSMVEMLDERVRIFDEKIIIRSILEQYISKIADTKLAALLSEFNQMKDKAPNFTAIGFRTILCLIIYEKAKHITQPPRFVTRGDLNLEEMLREAIEHNYFSSGGTRVLKRFRDTKKDIFDNLSHKPGVLAHKDTLEDVVDMLNELLPEII